MRRLALLAIVLLFPSFAYSIDFKDLPGIVLPPVINQGGGGNSSSSGGVDEIFVFNKCNKEIRVVVRYMAPNERWRTSGWYQVEPKKKVKVATSINQYVYFYAETVDGEGVWSGDYTFEISGELQPYEFMQVDVGSEWVKHTQSFSC